MRKIFILFLVLIMVASCKEDYIGQYPIHGTPPPPISNVRVENLPGAAKLTYDLPIVDDLLYIKALYTTDRGRKREMMSSAYSNTILLKGFGRGQKHNVILLTVDKSFNESSPVTVEIEPFDSPIHDALQTFHARESFGGVSLTWENPLKENMVLETLAKDETDGQYKYVETIYTAEAKAKRAVRGLADVPTDFAFFFRDTYGNYSDTVYTNLTPLFEEELNKTKFVPLRLSSKFSLHSYGGANMTKLWNNIYNVDNDLYYVNTAPEKIYFGFDMGVEAKLSRFRLWTRRNYMYQLHHIRTFEIWGTSDPQATVDPDNWTGWVKIMDCESFRPSGAIEGGAPTAEEEQYLLGGEEWEIPLDAPPFRYFRFFIHSTWSNSRAAFINEITIWGSTKLE